MNSSYSDIKILYCIIVIFIVMGDTVYTPHFNTDDNKFLLRTEIINYLIRKNNYKTYLEIGVKTGKNMKYIVCDTIHGVDPDMSSAAHFKVTSDDFFARLLKPEAKYDIIFIDGLHEEYQVMRDLENSLQHLAIGGTIVMHDCNPPTEWHQHSPDILNGTTWRAFVRYRAMRPDLTMHCVDTDWGCGIVRLNEPHVQSPFGSKQTITLPDPLTYQDLVKNRVSWLNLITTSNFKELY